MPLLSIVFVLIVLGFLLYLLNLLPIDGKMKQVINAIIIFIAIMWVLNLFFPLGSLGPVRTPVVIR